ncbi:MAG: hypothetical protein JTT11_07345 [Candidatus Brockarchaeota archaeon]|nr:hypothetical protein [Candidatus Brockarchaeota archaeon]
MPNQDLGSELARASLGIVPASSVPELVLSQFSLIGWDRQKNPGILWKLTSLVWQDTSEGKVTTIDGFKVGNNEIVAVLRGGEVAALVPEGSWVMKPESELAEGEINASGFELVWLDLRPLTLGFDVEDLRIQGASQRLRGELTLRITDPAKTVSRATQIQGKSQNLSEEVIGRLSSIMREEASILESYDPSWQPKIAEASKKRLSELLSEWGMSLADFKVEGKTGARVNVEEGRRPGIQEEGTARAAARFPEAAPAQIPQKAPPAGDKIIQMLDWDAAPKRWVPASRKGEIRCDGCGEKADAFSVCALSCRFLQKCRLCKRCYHLRRVCAFFVPLETLQPRRRALEEGKEIAKADVGRRIGSRY